MSGTLRSNRLAETDDVLLVDDDAAAISRAQAAFDIATDARLLIAEGRDEALARLHGRDEYEGATLPDLVLLDPELEGMAGYDVLKTIRNEPTLAPLPVIVLTTAVERDDVVRTYEEKANAFVPKPGDEETFVDIVTAIDRFWLEQVHLPPITR